jgi:hypothetical protein
VDRCDGHQPEGEPFRELLKIALPVPVRVLGVITKALTREYGQNVVMMQTGQFLIFRLLEKPRERIWLREHLNEPFTDCQATEKPNRKYRAGC